MFIFFKPGNGKLIPVPRNQIKLRRFQGGYRVFLPEALEAIKKNSSNFKLISADMQKLVQKDMAIFADGHESLDKIITLLREDVLAATQLTDLSEPATGHVFYYLARSVTPCSEGSYGSSSQGVRVINSCP